MYRSTKNLTAGLICILLLLVNGIPMASGSSQSVTPIQSMTSVQSVTSTLANSSAPPQAPILNTRTTRTRSTFSTTGDLKRGPNPFQDKDFTHLTKQATGVFTSTASTIDPEVKAMVESLTDPFYLRKLAQKRAKTNNQHHTSSGRVPMLGFRNSNPKKSTSQRNPPWSNDTLLANPTNMNDEYVSLAESPLTGNLYAVFAAKDLGGTDRDIHIAQSTNQGQTWSVIEMPSFSQDEYQPEIAIDAAGYIHVTWIRDDGWVLRSRTSAPDDTSDWAWVRGLGTEETHATPSIAVSGTGDFATVFIAAGWLTVNWDLYQYEWTIIFMYSTNGGQTITYDYFNPDGYQDLWPDVAINNGLVHLLNAEVDYYSGETEILMASDTYNGSFGDLGYFSGYTSNNTGFPQVACQDENVYVVFQEDYTDGMTADGDIIYAYSWDSGETFFGPFGMAADEYESVGPSVFTRDGVVGVLWLDAPPNADEFWLGSRMGSGFGHTDLFGSVELVSDEPRVEPMFHSCFGTAAAGRMHAAWIDRRDYATEGHNVYTSNRAVAGNLAPFTPSDWDTVLTANMIRGQHSQGYLAADDTTFISFAFLNNGLADITGNFNFELKLDGISQAQWSVENGLGTGTYVPVEDFPLVVSAGEHSLSFYLDTHNQIDETNELDNFHTQTFTWVDGDPVLRLNPQHLTKTIIPDKSRNEALQFIDHPILKHEAHLPVIAGSLAQAIDNSTRDDWLRVMIVPVDRLDPTAMSRALQGVTRATRREVITQAAKTQMARTLSQLQPQLNNLALAGRGQEPTPLWLSGCIAMELTPSAIEELSDNPLVGQIWLDNQKSETFSTLTPNQMQAPDSRANAWHIAKIGADRAWSAGHTGSGIVVGHLDTGVAYDHPDLAGQMWDGGSQYPHHGYDTVSDDDDPYDGDTEIYHGTHTAGLIAGNGTAGTTTGVAPGATIMAIRAIPGYMNDMIEGLQFGLDNGAHLFNLSGGWALGSDNVRATNRYNAELLLSIDVPWICAAGNGDNYGGHYPVPTDISSPGDCPGPYYHPNGGATAVVTVGASLSTNDIWQYSSYGPTQWDLDNTNGDTDYHDYPWPSGLMKPDITAPGGNITSCTGGDGYITYSGTSMATPLVTAAFCIIWSAEPGLLVPQVCELLENTALDLSQSPASPGRDNFTGAGLLNIFAALGQLPTAETEFFWVCNDGDLPLILSGATWNSDWLEIITPTEAIAPGDSIQAMAIIDPAGLPEGHYYDTASINSNDPQSPHNLNLTLIYGQSTSSVQDALPWVDPKNLNNHPNPFNPRTTLKFSTSSQAKVNLGVYDLRGHLVRNLILEVLPSGVHEVVWDGLNNQGLAVSSGQYFARLQEGLLPSRTRKLLLVR